VNIALGRPVVLQKLISHDWKTGEVQNVYDLADYKEKWGYVSYPELRRLLMLTFQRFIICFIVSTCMRC
jgi:hypothetical protein